MANIGGVNVLELRENFSEGVAWGEGTAASKAYLVDWPNRYTVANSLLGLTTYTVVGGKLTINAPGVYPDSPSMYARQVNIRGAGMQYQGPKQTAFDYAIVSVNYAVPRFDPPGSDPGGQQSLDPSAPLIYATQSIHASGQWITIPRSYLKTASGKNLEQEFGRFVGVNNIRVVLHQFPYLVTSTQRSLIGKMNNAAFFGAATGTLMLHAIDTQRTCAVDGTVNQEVTYEMSERPEAAWNWTFTGVAANNGWEKVTTINATDPIPSADYTALIPGFYRGV